MSARHVRTKETKMATKTKTKTERPVLITTAHRGVFFGYATATDGDCIKLSKARNCLYWDAATRGFMGLAANGPTSGCRIGPAVDIEVRNITSVVEVTPEAAAKWDAATWR